MGRPSVETLEDVRTVLQILPSWQLKEDAWEVVRSSLDALQQALLAADGPRVRAYLDEIEMHAPVRRIPITSTPIGRSASEPPEPVVELLNKIVHSIDRPRSVP